MSQYHFAKLSKFFVGMLLFSCMYGLVSFFYYDSDNLFRIFFFSGVIVLVYMLHGFPVWYGGDFVKPCSKVVFYFFMPIVISIAANYVYGRYTKEEQVVWFEGFVSELFLIVVLAALAEELLFRHEYVKFSV
ncbi:hypothetical protein [Rheinheimera baltica]|uniref:hypothetical protein n=1 Tax=Rheinheimera baltica TaxID=67576 RepID=UPI00048104F2|nr:hypothetical protein [Rheinheimera baltica]